MLFVYPLRLTFLGGSVLFLSSIGQSKPDEAAHGRRQFVEVAANFPEPCRYVLERLGDIYKYAAEARQRHLSPAERLEFHQQHSGPGMEQLHDWLEAEVHVQQRERTLRL